MPQIIEQCEHDQIAATAIERNYREQYREQLISLLPEIGADLTAALTAADLHIPVFMSVPRTGDSFLTFATPVDPSDSEWERVGEIVREVVEETSGIAKLLVRDLPCISAGMATIATGELCTDRLAPPDSDICDTCD